MAKDIRKAIDRYGHLSDVRLLFVVRQIVEANIPGFAHAFGDGLLSAWIAAARIIGKVAEDEPRVIELAKPVKPVRWPVIEKAAEWVASRRLVEPSELSAARAKAEREATLTAHVAGEQILEQVRTAIVKAAESGQTNIRRFIREHVGDLNERELEALYRTQQGLFWSEGQRTILDNPLVGDEFPYVLYSAVHDSRVEDTHLAMESLGLDGTAVYRADDPVIRKFWPPWRWNCRCHVIPLSIEDAARRGVREAMRWVKTGNPPIAPQYVEHPPFDLPPGWPSP